MTATLDTTSIPEVGVDLAPIERRALVVGITGTTPLIMNKFSEKAKLMMLEAQNKTTVKTKREAQNPEAEFNAARYILPDGRDGVPAVSFKAALVGAARLFEGITMVQLKVGIHVEGEGPEQLVPIVGSPVMHEGICRVGQGTANLRYRPMYDPWSTTLKIHFVPSIVSHGSVIALLNAAGMGGIGEWRPSAPKSLTGTYGQFMVNPDAPAYEEF